MNDVYLILLAVLGIAALLVLVIRVKLHAFVALLLVSLIVAVLAGVPLGTVADTIEEGMGGTLGFVAVVVGLGAMFGQLLEVSGGAERLAQTLIGRFGEERAPLALGLTGFIVAVPVFFDVALIILIAVIYDLTRDTRRPLLYFGLPLAAGLAATHAFVPPTPGPVAVADLLGADLGWVILFGAIAALPATILAGPVFGRLITKRITTGVPAHMAAEREKAAEEAGPKADLPPFGMVAGLILVPLVLILINTVADILLPDGNPLKGFFALIGHPFSALLIATLLTFTLLGTRRGFTPEQVQEIATKGLEPAGIVILVTGAGGVFKQVLIDSGVGDVLGSTLAGSGLPPLLLAFIIATAVRLAQGSATVAMVTAGGLVAPLIQAVGIGGPQLALVAIAIASGATMASHVNDSGFWLVNRYFGLSVEDTLLAWTSATTIIGLTGLAVVLLLNTLM